jgi:hypothetical protein
MLLYGFIGEAKRAGRPALQIYAFPTRFFAIRHSGKEHRNDEIGIY